jgi:hypothetical protein
LVEVNADEGTQTAMVQVQAFEIRVSITNRTDGANITIDVFDLKGNRLTDVELNVTLKYPSERNITYNFVSNQTINMTFNTTENGRFDLLVIGIDRYGRMEGIMGSFLVLKPTVLNLILDPEGFNETLSVPVNLSYSVDIKNNGTANVTNISVIKSGTVGNWIYLFNATLPNIPVNGTSKIYFDLRIPAVNEGNYSGAVRIFSTEGMKEIPIYVKVKASLTLNITPSSWTEYIPIKSKISKEFILENKGNANLTVLDVELEGDIDEIGHTIGKPSKILVGAKEKMNVSFDTSKLTLTSASVRYSGSISVETDKVEKTIPVTITVMKDLTQELSPFQTLLTAAETNVSKLSSSTLEGSEVNDNIRDVRSLISDVKSLYEKGNYKDALAKFDSLKSKLEELIKEVLRLQEVEAKKGEFPKLVMNILAIAVVSVVIFLLVIWFINSKRGGKKVPSEDRYSWLYRKYRK